MQTANQLQYLFNYCLLIIISSKCNVDGSFFGKPGLSGIGGAMRNH